MTHEFTVDISAPAYDQALKFCNLRLAEKGMPAITELPAGRVGDPGSCPCAEACGVRVYTRDWYWPDDTDDQKSRSYRDDDMPQDFVWEFDLSGGRLLILKNEWANNPYILPIRKP